jgi:hypothetical protein
MAMGRELKLGRGLQIFMGGRKYCDEHDLTREFLLEYLLSKQDEVSIASTFHVVVQSLSGEEFVVKMDQNENQVRHLKEEIEKLKGLRVSQQELYLGNIATDEKGESNSVEPLMKDCDTLQSACTVTLCVAVPPDHLHWAD